MPLFNPLIDPRKLRPRPGAPDPLPEARTPPFLPPTSSGPPGGMTPMPESLSRGLRGPSRYEQMNEARDVYAKGAPGRLKSGLLGALRGGLQGLATGGLGGAIGGALAGGGFGAISPTGLRKQRFEEEIAPQIRERFAYEDADRAAAMAQAKAAGEQAMNRMQLENINSQIQSRQAQDALNQQKADMEANKPMTLSPGATIYDPKEQRAVFTAPKEERQQAPVMRLGRNRKTGRFSYYNTLDPRAAAEHEPDRFTAPPRAAKPPAEKKYVSISKVKEFAEKQGITESEAKARARQDGFIVVQ